MVDDKDAMQVHDAELETVMDGRSTKRTRQTNAETNYNFIFLL